MVEVCQYVWFRMRTFCENSLATPSGHTGITTPNVLRCSRAHFSTHVKQLVLLTLLVGFPVASAMNFVKTKQSLPLT